MKRLLSPFAAFSLLLTSASAVTLYKPDTFDSTLEGWQGGSNLVRRSTGGPGGAGDGYMEINSTGATGNGSRWVVYNNAQWTGDFQFALADAIRMDVINTGSADLHLRVAFGDNTGPLNGGTWFASATAITIAPGSGWTSVLFPITDNDLVAVTGAGDFDDVLSGVVSMRILSSVLPSAFGDQVALQGGIDNIRAVPEPSASVLVLLAGAWLGRRSRRRA